MPTMSIILKFGTNLFSDTGNIPNYQSRTWVSVLNRTEENYYISLYLVYIYHSSLILLDHLMFNPLIYKFGSCLRALLIEKVRGKPYYNRKHQIALTFSYILIAIMLGICKKETQLSTRYLSYSLWKS